VVEKSSLRKGAELWLPFLFARLPLLFILSPTYSDLSLYRTVALKLFEFQEWPYRDFPFEYPPLALLPIYGAEWLKEIFSWPSLVGYRWAFGLLVLPFDAFVYGGLARDLRGEFRHERHLGLWYLGLTTILGILVFDRLDLFLMALMVAPFVYWGRNPPVGVLGFWFSMGASFKILPLFLAAGLLPLIPSLRKSLLFLSFLAALFLPSLLVAYWLSPVSSVSFLEHHSLRGIQVESLVGAFCLLLKNFGWAPEMGIVSDYGAQHLSAWPWLAPFAKGVWIFFFLSTMALLFLTRKRTSLLRGVYLLLVSFVAWGYVLSPQFLLWLIPFGLLLWREEGEQQGAALLIAVVVLTGIHFLFYPLFLQQHWFSLALVNGRNFLFILLYFLLVRSSLRFYEESYSQKVPLA
jgi:hypothetical protein